ncbi:similar to Saccharomyces cerevisiae YPR017C DSS4 Guanine nucleotide dissociation stimulator for Sec4p, functions in the post-Golgi secretory pathway [Maudiozyma barnettii]|uniref:Similar to Saccharomyces cerevisiae YPR017C DSS4 Guanine nucleotide dissociation stimulator for Sec4p, functions in the post-Golgi secretory pathway n=1 Tax=Maudiozyma barnettii TaxID=61262 RepID=A0A8H2VF67_9SACH|nr:guanine nucleotide exchange factor DSS4 [Kazachstania barnettii]CAB4254361.1 similar to Saccharomyces cerevisiae YPR017C DSS4 Guanine nucleotide dissociation stimulator for Sec4p, functions in the post-Golgi secretory pathway [Kazachstania barnettii]CAD1782233.1 similar to Saccharomyces cerevisiae YPR017C DSS4 Guanine nucleotide dissociation stimulator for Sec4p, functions in the post-Golgi secretory pathway [Kazachstania barnettii]
MSKAVCAFEACGCKIITINDANIISLPNTALDTFRLMRHRKEVEQDNNKNSDFLIVGDVWDFDNIGVSRDIPATNITDVTEGSLITADDFVFSHEDKIWTITKCVKYLICADCDKGPIGMVCEIADKSTGSDKKIVHMLSLKSVTH